MRSYFSLVLLILQLKIFLFAATAESGDYLEKRAVQSDLLSNVSCRYIRDNGHCKYSFIKNKLCYKTCGCLNIFSKRSCNIAKAKNQCQTLWSTKFCRLTCHHCNRLSCKYSHPLGMKSGAIPDSRITASSMYTRSHSPVRARLDMKAGAGSWSARSNNLHEWLQVDLGNVTKVTGIATQGRFSSSERVTKYSLQYSVNGRSFNDYESGKIFTANKDSDTVVKHSLKPAIIARYIRVRPKTWNSWISMRMELYGCI